MIRAAIISLVVFTNPALAGDDAELTGREFVMPSRNIACIVQDVNLEGGKGPSQRVYCVRNLPTTIAVVLDERGVESYPTEGDQPFSERAEVLQYDDDWAFGDFKCTSMTTGMICAHNIWGGFELSRAGFKKLD